MGKSPSFLLIFNHLAFWHPFTLFSAVNKRIELQAWDWTQIKAYCKGFPYLISFFVVDILKLILYELQINFMLISPAVWWRTQLILALILIIVSWRHRDFGKTIDTDFLKNKSKTYFSGHWIVFLCSNWYDKNKKQLLCTLDCAGL